MLVLFRMPLTTNGTRLLMRQIRDIVEHPVDCIALLPSRDLCEVWFELDGPEGTPFSEGRFVIVLHFGEQYPDVPPRGSFRTPIFHPNVAPVTGEICVNTLKKDWHASMGLQHILVVIRCLLVEPNPESALHEEAGRLIFEDYNSYTRQALMMTRVHARRGAGVPRHHYPTASGTTISETVENAGAVANSDSSASVRPITSHGSSSCHCGDAITCDCSLNGNVNGMSAKVVPPSSPSSVDNTRLRLEEGKNSSSAMHLDVNQGIFSTISSSCIPSDTNLTNSHCSSAGKRFMENDSMVDYCFLGSRKNGEEDHDEMEKKKHYGKEDGAEALEYRPSAMASSPHNSSSPLLNVRHHHPSSLSNLTASLPIRETGLRAVDSNVPPMVADKAMKKAAEKRKTALRRL